MTIKPLADRVLVSVLEEEQQTTGGIFIPDSAKEKPLRGKVVATGSGKFLENGTIKPTEVNTSEVVIFAKYAGTDIKTQEGTFKILNESDILAVIN